MPCRRGMGKAVVRRHEEKVRLGLEEGRNMQVEKVERGPEIAKKMEQSHRGKGRSQENQCPARHTI